MPLTNLFIIGSHLRKLHAKGCSYENTAELFEISAAVPGECTVQGDRIDVHTTFYTKEHALSVIVSYGTKVDIVSPDELRNDVIDHIEAIRRHYGNKRGGDET